MAPEISKPQRTIAAIAAYIMALVFLVSGGWKVLKPFTTGEILEQAKVPAGLGVAGASTLGTIELFAAIMLLLPQLLAAISVPKFRNKLLPEKSGVNRPLPLSKRVANETACRRLMTTKSLHCWESSSCAARP